jgi:hypothetical protein
VVGEMLVILPERRQVSPYAGKTYSWGHWVKRDTGRMKLTAQIPVQSSAAGDPALMEASGESGNGGRARRAAGALRAAQHRR